LFLSAAELNPRNVGLHDISENENALELWKHVKRLCTVVVINADPEKVQRDADLRFNSISQHPTESVSRYYDRYLQEVIAWVEAGNALVETEIIVEGDDPDR
jgi:archaellum biogenesis ATPase FlaH